MSIDAFTPPRRRVIEDMNASKLCAQTQGGHIHSCKRFAEFLKRSPETATVEDIRRFQLHLSETGINICSHNRIMTGVRFLFRVTLRLRRLDLRQPRDRHRDFRALLRAEVPPHAAGGNQDRHLMMPSPSIYTYSNARHSYRLSGGIAQARIAAAFNSRHATNPVALPADRSFTSTHATLVRRKLIAATASIQPQQARTLRQNPHSARGAAPANLPRFRALALFGRRLQERADSVGIPASKNLHKRRPHVLAAPTAVGIAAWIVSRGVAIVVS
jgi:hypothetical protein